MGALRFLLLMLLASARTSAARLLEWASEEENATALQSFASKVTASLNMAFGSRVKKIKRQREKVWAKYHEVRTSVEFLSLWSSFTTASLGKPAGLILSQHLANLIFRQIIQQHFPLEDSPGAEDDLPNHSDLERNALRYAAGYICRNLRKKLERSSHLLKEELVLGIMGLLDCEDEDDDDQEATSSETWLNSIDRGGLWHTSDTTFVVSRQWRRLLGSS